MMIGVGEMTGLTLPDRTAVPASPATYRAYGCSISSDFPLPELDPRPPAVPAAADLRIRRARLDGPIPDEPYGRIVEIGEAHSYFAWHGLGCICVRADGDILVDPLPEFDLALIGLVLLGPVMAAALHQRGLAIFHGSTVATPNGEALLLLGDNGAGKSSFAAACLKAGFMLVNDDVCALSLDNGSMVEAQPGAPALKLSGEALALFDSLPGAILPGLPATAAKQRLRLDSLVTAPRPIAHIHILRRGDRPDREALPPAERLAALMRYSYMPKFGPGALSGRRAEQHFAQCAAIADRVPVSLLTVPGSIEALMAMPPDLLAALRD